MTIVAQNIGHLSGMILMTAHLITTIPISTLVTEGLAKITGFEVLRHGTSWNRYLGIIQNGADPQKIRDMRNLTDPQQEPINPRFYVFKDTEMQPNIYHNPFIESFKTRYRSQNFLLDIGVPTHLFKRLAPRNFSMSAALMDTGLAAGLSTNDPNQVSRQFTPWVVTKMAASFLCALVIGPTVRFVYRKPELHEVFQEDLEYVSKNYKCGSLAYMTIQKLPPNRIGLLGLLSHIRVSDLTRAWQESPLRVCVGGVQLAAGIALTSCGLGLFI